MQDALQSIHTHLSIGWMHWYEAILSRYGPGTYSTNGTGLNGKSTFPPKRDVLITNLLLYYRPFYIIIAGTVEVSGEPVNVVGGAEKVVVTVTVTVTGAASVQVAECDFCPASLTGAASEDVGAGEGSEPCVV